MKYHIITYGCQMNESDGERLAAKLEKKGYQPAELEKADLVVLNACSVRQSAINRLNSKVQKISSWRPKRKIILTGCLLEKDKKRLKDQVDTIWPIIGWANRAKCRYAKQALVPIMNGCNNFCSYCVVPYTRGREVSRPAQDILREVRYLIKNGYQEITLLGQNVNSYRDSSVIPAKAEIQSESKAIDSRFHWNDNGAEINFPKLLRVICQVPGDFIIKFLTSHPKDMSDELIDAIAQEEKITKEIHLPFQSGNNAILKKMNRQYTIGHYKNLIKKIQKKIPTARLSTDIIVGFPSETEKQFQDTVGLMKEIKFYQAYIASYSPRSQTEARKIKDDISSFEKKRRKKVLLNMLK